MVAQELDYIERIVKMLLEDCRLVRLFLILKGITSLERVRHLRPSFYQLFLISLTAGASE